MLGDVIVSLISRKSGVVSAVEFIDSGSAVKRRKMAELKEAISWSELRYGPSAAGSKRVA